MRQRLDDPIFNFSNSTVAGQSVSSAALTSATTSVFDSAAFNLVVAQVQSLKTQLIAVGLIKAS